MSVFVRRSDDGQILFNRVLFAFALTIKFILKVIVYSPLIYLSWLITKQLLDTTANKILTIVLILLFSIALYYIIFFVKGMLIALKYNGNLFWVPLLLILIVLTCVLPMYIIFTPLETFIRQYTTTNQALVTWIFSFAFGLYVYSKYHFLTNIAPIKAFPYYQRGIIITNHLLRFSKGLKAKKSAEVI